MENIKKNLTLYIGLGIPVLMILLIAVLVYGGRLFSNVPPPAYDFVYATGDSVIYPSIDRYAAPYPSNPCAKYYYRVASGTIQRFESNASTSDNFAYCKNNIILDAVPKFYVHDVETNTSKEIAFENLQKITVDSSPKAPDGYELTRGSNSGSGFPFFYGNDYDYSTRFLVKDGRAEKLDLQIPRDMYYNDVFLGWVTQGA